MLHLVDHSVEDIKTFGEMSVLNPSVYILFNAHIRRACRGPTKRRAARMNQSVMLIEWHQSSERPRISTEVGFNMLIVVHEKSVRCTEHGCVIVQTIYPGCFDGIVGCLSSEEKKKARNVNVRTSLNMFPKHIIKVLPDLVQTKRQEKWYAQS